MLLVPSLINTSKIWDLRAGDSFVEGLLGRGHDVFLIDWGVADERDADNALSTYVDDYLPAAYAQIEKVTGSGAVVIGHCFGGVICVLWAASAREEPLALVTLGTPTNWAEMGPLSHLTEQGRLDPEDVLDESGNVPPAALLRAFQMLRPLGDLAGYVTLWDRLDDRRAAQAIRALTDWAHTHVPFPGAAFVEMINQISRENGLYTGEVVLGRTPPPTDRHSMLPFPEHLRNARPRHPTRVGPAADRTGRLGAGRHHRPAGRAHRPARRRHRPQTHAASTHRMAHHHPSAPSTN